MSSVRVISQETVKPSSPTPPNLRTYKLSWNDQLLTVDHMLTTLFFPDDGNHNNGFSETVVGRLKASLSETLTHFYPLAGRLVWNTHVDCNDDGVEFYQTRVNGPLNRAIIQPPDLGIVNQLLPCTRSCCVSPGSNILLSVQVNVFDCHGIAIGVCFSHKIADGRSLLLFLQSWAAFAAGDSPPPAEPAFNGVYHFPANERANPLTWTGNDPKAAAVLKRVVFDASQISAMKSKSPLVPSPSRVEAVVGLIWRCLVRAMAKARGEPNRGSMATLPVDTRFRVEPPWSDRSFGNHCIASAASATAEEASIKEEGVLEERFRSSVRAIGSRDYLRRLQGEDGFTVAYDEIAQATGECVGGDFDIYVFTSWLRFPLYEVDFGWGKPIWVFINSAVRKNVIYLMPRKGDEGVEAWITLDEKHMAEFERDEELLPFASHPTNSPVAD